MSNQNLTPDLLQSATADLNGKRFSIEGLLVVSGESAHIDISSSGMETHVPINDSTLIERLLDQVPCYLGGECLYRDRVQLIGFVAAAGGNSVAISTVESGLLSRDGETFSF